MNFPHTKIGYFFYLLFAVLTNPTVSIVFLLLLTFTVPFLLGKFTAYKMKNGYVGIIIGSVLVGLYILLDFRLKVGYLHQDSNLYLGCGGFCGIEDFFFGFLNLFIFIVAILGFGMRMTRQQSNGANPKKSIETQSKTTAG